MPKHTTRPQHEQLAKRVRDAIRTKSKSNDIDSCRELWPSVRFCSWIYIQKHETFDTSFVLEAYATKVNIHNSFGKKVE